MASEDSLIAFILAVAAAGYLLVRKQGFLIIWLVIGYLLSYNALFKYSRILSVLAGITLTYLVLLHTINYEFFDNEEKEKKEEDPQPTGKSTPHVDLGTTILHAYRNLSPEQIGGMKRDTKELMELQKELMGTLAEMKPAIEQGAELLGTFSQFFGKDGAPPS